MTNEQADLLIKCVDNISNRLSDLIALLAGDGPGVSVSITGGVDVGGSVGTYDDPYHGSKL